MKYKVGDRVRIKSIDWYEKNKSNRGYVTIVCEAEVAFTIEMSSLCGQIVTISQKIYTQDVEFYRIREDRGTYMWVDEMIEGLVEEGVSFDVIVEETIKDISDKVVDTIMGGLMVGKSFNLPEGHIFKDENGNIINATKIVLEKKKKECPKTYEECCRELNIVVRDLDILMNMLDSIDMIYCKNLDKLLNSFRKLRICRDAYWKIAGEEMGLGKPWEPDWGKGACYTICCNTNRIVIGIDKFRNSILAFPTEEMRDAFYENFKELIEQCKELL